MEVSVKLADIKAGDYMCTDGGFTCMKPGLHLVEADQNGLFLKCDEGTRRSKTAQSTRRPEREI
jgi:hypothetical protein